jgi:hypothetical protein
MLHAYCAVYNTLSSICRLSQIAADMTFESLVITAAANADAKTGRSTAIAVPNSSDNTSSACATLQKAMSSEQPVMADMTT